MPEKPLKKNAKSHAELILGGKAEIYLMPRSGRVYQVRMWIPEEGKYLRRSLKTTDRETAVQRAEELVFRTFSDIASGRRLFGISLGELADLYLQWRRKDVEIGQITEGRWITIRSQVRALLRVKDPSLKLGELDKNSFYDWRQMRLTDNPGISLVTVRNETATIKQMFEFAYREGLVTFPTMIFRPLSLKREEVGRRDTFSPDEYDALVGYMRSYVSKKHCPDELDREQRLVVRDFILILSNTCLRVGELRQLRWSDIKGIEHKRDDAGRKVALVSINVRAETSKVRSSRQIITRGGEYIERLRHNSPYTNPDDLLFSNRKGTHQLGTRELYKHWYALMEGIGIDDHRERKLSYYSLRHFGITMRLRVGVPVFDVASMAGTSVSHIESHYGHIDDQMKISAALKNTVFSRDGISDMIPNANGEK